MSCSKWKKNAYKDPTSNQDITEDSRRFKNLKRRCKTDEEDFPNNDDCVFVNTTMINPITGRKLKQTSKILSKLINQCKPKKNSKEEKLQVCQEWLKSKGKINPRTKRRLSSTKGKVYMNLFNECKSFGLSLKPLGVRFSSEQVKIISPRTSFESDEEEYVLPSKKPVQEDSDSDEEEYVLPSKKPVDEDSDSEEYVLPSKRQELVNVNDVLNESREIRTGIERIVEKLPDSTIKERLENVEEDLNNSIAQLEQAETYEEKREAINSIEQAKKDMIQVITEIEEEDLSVCKRNAYILLMIKGIINRFLDDLKYPRRDIEEKMLNDEKTKKFLQVGQKTNFSKIKKFRDEVRSMNLSEYKNWDVDTTGIKSKCNGLDKYMINREIYQNIDNFVNINSKLSENSRKQMDDDDVLFDEPKRLFASRYIKK